MKIKRFICAALAVAMLAMSGCAQEEKEAFDVTQVKLTSAQANEVSTKTDKELTKNKFSGGAVITLNKNTVFDQNYGYTSEKKNKKNDSSTVYQISSVTKVFTGAAIAIMLDEGTLKKNDKISAYIPGAKDNKETKDITIEELLLKKKDFGKYTDYFITTSDQLQKYNKMVNKNYKKADEQLKKDITEVILNIGTSQTSKVADSNYFLLGRIIEKASGKSYEDFVFRRT